MKYKRFDLVTGTFLCLTLFLFGNQVVTMIKRMPQQNTKEVFDPNKSIIDLRSECIKINDSFQRIRKVLGYSSNAMYTLNVGTNYNDDNADTLPIAAWKINGNLEGIELALTNNMKHENY